MLAARRETPPESCASCHERPVAVLDRHSRNRRRLKAYAEADDPASRLRWRNLLVEDNLPLVFAIAGRQSQDSGLGFDDLAQVGSLGLIRAIEAFDPARKVSLSSFAVPYIQGAMQRERRDRQPLVRPPRPLWDLHQQVQSLQESRRRQGLDPLPAEALATTLACDPQRIEEALQVRRASRVQSLDAPLGQGAGEPGAGSCLLDLLASPAAEGSGEAAPSDKGTQAAERAWLRQQLEALDPLQRELLVGRIQVGCTWVELGQQLGMPPRQAQRRCHALLDRLRSAAIAWRQERGLAGGDGTG